jgi:hypothetical protein
MKSEHTDQIGLRFMTDWKVHSTMRSPLATFATLMAALFMISLSSQSVIANSSREAPIQHLDFEFYQAHGVNATEVLSLNGTSETSLKDVHWDIMSLKSGDIEPLLVGDYLTSVVPSGEERWSWSLVMDVEGLNCTCAVRIHLFGGMGHSQPPPPQLIVYLGEQNHVPVLKAPLQSHFLLTEGEMDVNMEAVSPLGTLLDSVVTVHICEAPNLVCLQESIPFKINATVSDMLTLHLDAESMNLEDGFWKFEIMLEDRALSPSNTISFFLQLDRMAPAVSLSNTHQRTEMSTSSGDSPLDSAPHAQEADQILFTAEVYDGYEGSSEVLTWSKISPDGQQTAFMEGEYITPSSVSLTPDKAGQWSVVLLVRDSAGHLVRATSTINVENVAPKAVVFLDGLQISSEDVLTLPYGDSWILNATQSTDTLNDLDGLSFQWYFDDELIQNGGSTLEGSIISTSGTHTVRLVVQDDDESSSELIFTLSSVEDDVSGSEGLVGGNAFTIGFVFVIFTGAFLLTRMGRSSPDESLPKWQRKQK